ncbi:Enterocin F4-9 [Carnobacterium maltaromaticum]|uniref:hypothetical protein n=1 Tax=Carnobacterium maltaromaticum TaxID=2751 RepID=UPI00191BC777|nr:hypothetical protein [Carnobacterium maltaromaticum]CAD5897031.1 Enterocin F4-9 [Carnobacterium maltaromaticum]
MKKENALLKKMSLEEMSKIEGGAYKCPPMPANIKKKPNSSVYYAWVYANCSSVSSCSPTTWNTCVR